MKEEHPRNYVLSVRAVPYRRGRPLARRERGELRRERGELWRERGELRRERGVCSLAELLILNRPFF